MKPVFSKLGAAFFIAALALLAASCGRRGALEPPPGTPAWNVPLSGTPGEYETPANQGGQPEQDTANSSGAEEPAQPAPKPSQQRAPKPFLLDPLL